MSEDVNPHVPPNDDIIYSLNNDIDAYKEALQHIKRILMVKVHEYSTEILRLESAIHDPKSLFSGKARST